MSNKFVHLHVHSHYSLLDGLPKIDELVAEATKQNSTALALTDHGVLYGAVEFYQKAKAAKIKPIIGCEVYVAPHGHTNKRAKIDESNYHLILLASDDTGYHNLMKLVSLAHLDGFYYRPRIDHELLRQYSQGLIALSGCLKGEIPSAILSGEMGRAKTLITEYQNIFGKENFFLELQHHPSLPDQATVNQSLKKLTKETGAALVATADSHYLHPEDSEAQDILLSIHQKKKLDDKDRWSMANEDLSLASGEDMAEIFSDVPEAITNTAAIAARCNVTIKLGQIQLPHFTVPAGETPDSYLKKLSLAGIPARYTEVTEQLKNRLEFELGVITKTGFATYFLIVHDLVNWAKRSGIVVGPGRGSAAGSLVSYLLNITNVDPIKYELLFERFLNPDRIAMPDIDIDFADVRRDEVLRYVESKYGQDHVAQVITFGTMAARAAIRDVGRVLGLPYSYCDRVAKLIPMFASLDQALRSVPELKEIYDNDPDARRLLNSAKKLEGVARHASRHACAVVITADPLDHYLPVQHASPEDTSIITQYSMHPIEDLGLLKMDFLGLSNLTILETCIDIIQHTHGKKINLDTLPLDDAATFALLQRGETTGVFQLESGGMRRYLKELKPTKLEDIDAMVALYRPGPMELIPQFIAGKHGRHKPKYLDPRLEPILTKTYGVAVYQEQVMQMARELAGFTMAEADVLRKAVGKKILKLLNEQRTKFVAGCVTNGMMQSTAEKIFEFIEPFARYGFNRAHSICYALIAYQTAYFKANYPAEFMAALLSSDQHNSDRIAIEIEEARRMGLHVLPPDINESFASFAVVPDPSGIPRRIRFGLGAVKNVGDNLVAAMIKERKRGGPYTSLEDWLRRVKHKDLNKKSLESLARVGALDQLAEPQMILGNINDILKFTKGEDEAVSNGQTNLFGMFPTRHSPALRLRSTEPLTPQQRGQWEKELLGLYITHHPLKQHQHALAMLAQPLSDLPHQTSERIKVAGMITSVKKITTKNNESMAFVRLEDMTGTVEVVVFPRIYRDNVTAWQPDRLVIINGKRSQKDGEWKILADQVNDIPADALNSRPPIQIQIALEQTSSAMLDELKTLLAGSPGDQPVALIVTKGRQQKRIPTKHRISFTPELRQSVESLFGQCIVE